MTDVNKAEGGANEVLVHFGKQLAVAQGIHQGGALSESQLYAEKAQHKALAKLQADLLAIVEEELSGFEVGSEAEAVVNTIRFIVRQRIKEYFNGR